MTVLSFSQMESIWRQVAPGTLAGLAPVMAAIGTAESGGRTDAVNPKDNNGTQSSYGWLQISNGTHSPPSPNWADPVENARLGVQKVESQGLKAWGTWGGGASKKALAANGATDTSGSTQVQPLPGAPGSTAGGPLAGVTGAISQAGTLLGDAAKALDTFFHLFEPGQGRRSACCA